MLLQQVHGLKLHLNLTGTDKVTNLQLFFPAGKLPVNSKIYFDDIKLEYVN